MSHVIQMRRQPALSPTSAPIFRALLMAAQQATDANRLARLLFTHAVPFGAAIIFPNPPLVGSGEDQQPEHQLTLHAFIAAAMRLVIPITGAVKRSPKTPRTNQ
ncbi:MAG: hypothetical protein ACI96P_000558 [Candidatus Azotimanducaceae bacterium]|jgi:hypothetical protein